MGLPLWRLRGDYDAITPQATTILAPGILALWPAAPVVGRLVVVLSLAGFLVAVVGVPLPSFQAKTASSAKTAVRPFPCMHHACGCQDADQCWRKCCCFTKQEQLAWAHSHHVVPPAEFAAADDDLEHPRHESVAEKAGDAAEKTSDMAEKTGPAAAKSSHRACCHADRPLTSGTKQVEEQPSTTPDFTITYILPAQYRQCQGLAQLWSVLGSATPPPAHAEYSFDWQVVGWLSSRSITATSCSAPPPTPPPLG